MHRQGSSWKTFFENKFGIVISQPCFESLTNSYCRFAYPTCNQDSEKPSPKSICKETCEDTLKMCHNEIKKAKIFNKFSKKHKLPHLHWEMINCSLLRYRNGGDTPGCYYSPHLNSKFLEVKECLTKGQLKKSVSFHIT